MRNLFLTAASAAAFSVPASSPLVAYDGRTLTNGSTVTFDWVGVAARISLNNSFTYATVTITDACAVGNKFVVRLTAEGFSDLDVATFYTRAGTFNYTLFGDAGRSNFVGASAELTLVKAVEARFTQCDPSVGSGLSLDAFESDGAFLAPAARARRMEIIGDSITCGDLVYCVNAVGARFSVANGLWSDSHAASYGSRVCAALNASCSTIAWGGMGLIQNDVISWTWPTLPTVYESTLGWSVNQRGEGAPLQYPYNFSSSPPPSAVIIALGTNDAAGNFNNASFAARFVAEYVTFASQISTRYAAANDGAGPFLFIANGTCMTTVFAPSVALVVTALNARGLRATTLDLTLPNGTHCSCGHPSADEHLVMAGKALETIRKETGW